MEDIRIIKVKQSVFANNNSRAEEVRKKFLIPLIPRKVM